MGHLWDIWGRPGCEMDTTVEGGEIDPLNDPDIVFDSVSYEPTDEGKDQDQLS